MRWMSETIRSTKEALREDEVPDRRLSSRRGAWRTVSTSSFIVVLMKFSKLLSCKTMLTAEIRVTWRLIRGESYWMPLRQDRSHGCPKLKSRWRGERPKRQTCPLYFLSSFTSKRSGDSHKRGGTSRPWVKQLVHFNSTAVQRQDYCPLI